MDNEKSLNWFHAALERKTTRRPRSLSQAAPDSDFMIFLRQLTAVNTAARMTRSWGGRLHYRYLTWKSSFVTEAHIHRILPYGVSLLAIKLITTIYILRITFCNGISNILINYSLLEWNIMSIYAQ